MTCLGPLVLLALQAFYDQGRKSDKVEEVLAAFCDEGSEREAPNLNLRQMKRVPPLPTTIPHFNLTPEWSLLPAQPSQESQKGADEAHQGLAAERGDQQIGIVREE